MRSDYGTERWRELAAAVKRRDGWRCIRCGARSQLDAHHIHPVGHGGPMWDPDNIETLCRRCHQDQHPKWGEPREPVAQPSGATSRAEAERSHVDPEATPNRGGWATIGAIAGGGLGCVVTAGLALAFLAVDILGTWILAEWLQSHRWPSVAAWIVGFLIATTVISTVLYLAFALLAGAGLALAGALKWLWRHPLIVVAFLAGALLAPVFLVPPQFLPWNQRSAVPETTPASVLSESNSPQVPPTQTPVSVATPPARSSTSGLTVAGYAEVCATWWERTRILTASGTATYGQLVDHVGRVLVEMRAMRPPTELAQAHRSLTDLYAILWAWAQEQDPTAAFTPEAQISQQRYEQLVLATARVDEAVGQLPVAVFGELVARDCMGPNAQVTW